MRVPGRIDAAELGDVRLSADGSHLILRLRDTAGQTVSLSLPTRCLNTVLSALPRQVEMGTVHALDTWDMVPADNGQDMILRLSTPDGRAVSFAIKPWQVQGMATVATYGSLRAMPSRSIH